MAACARATAFSAAASSIFCASSAISVRTETRSGVISMKPSPTANEMARFYLTFLNLIDSAFHVEICFRHFVVLAVEDFLKAAHRLRDRNVLTFVASENFCDGKWLAEKPLNLPRTINH